MESLVVLDKCSIRTAVSDTEYLKLFFIVDINGCIFWLFQSLLYHGEFDLRELFDGLLGQRE